MTKNIRRVEKLSSFATNPNGEKILSSSKIPENFYKTQRRKLHGKQKIII